jgi:type I restriction enzyme, S subunit
VSAAFTELGSVAEFINGAAFKPEDWGEQGRRIIRIQNLTDSTKPYNRSTRDIPEKLHVFPGDLLVSWSASLGVFEWAGPDVALLNQHIFRVLPDERRVEKRYLRHGLEGALLEMQRHLHGATMQHVNRGEFLSTKLYLPPLAEQRRIAEVLDRAEALRAKRRGALAQLDSLTQSLFPDLFGDPDCNPRGWPEVKLGTLCEKVIDCPHATPVYVDYRTEYPCVRSSDIQNGELIFFDTKYVERSEYEKRVARGKPQVGDVIYCREGARFGNAARITDEANLCLGQRMMLFRPHPKAAASEYLWAFLSSPAAYHQATSLAGGSASPHVNIRDIISFCLPLPPIELQREFARRVQAVEKLKAAQRASLAEMDALFASLQHRAFRGEL